MKKLLEIVKELIEELMKLEIYTCPVSSSSKMVISDKFVFQIEGKILRVYYIAKKHRTIFRNVINHEILLLKRKEHEDYVDRYIFQYNITDAEIYKNFIIDLKIFLEEKENAAKELIDYLKAFDSLKEKKLKTKIRRLK